MAWRPFRNIGLKVAALGLGGLLWFTVSGQVVERSIRAPIEFINVPASLEITGDTTELVYVHLRGAENQISRIAAGDVRAVIDLGTAQAVVHGTFPLRTDQVVAPFGVEVMRVEPREVTLSLEHAGWRIVPLLPEIAGKPAAGFAMGPVSVDPATVDVVGPDSQLRQLDHATTTRISIDNATTTVVATVSVMVPDASLRLREPRVAKVTIPIVRVKGKTW